MLSKHLRQSTTLTTISSLLILSSIPYSTAHGEETMTDWKPTRENLSKEASELTESLQAKTHEIMNDLLEFSKPFRDEASQALTDMAWNIKHPAEKLSREYSGYIGEIIPAKERLKNKKIYIPVKTFAPIEIVREVQLDSLDEESLAKQKQSREFANQREIIPVYFNLIPKGKTRNLIEAGRFSHIKLHHLCIEKAKAKLVGTMSAEIEVPFYATIDHAQDTISQGSIEITGILKIDFDSKTVSARVTGFNDSTYIQQLNRVLSLNAHLINSGIDHLHDVNLEFAQEITIPLIENYFNDSEEQNRKHKFSEIQNLLGI